MKPKAVLFDLSLTDVDCTRPVSVRSPKTFLSHVTNCFSSVGARTCRLADTVKNLEDKMQLIFK